MDSDVKDLVSFSVLRRIDGPETFFIVGQSERTKLRFFKEFVLLNLTSTTMHFLDKVGKMARNEVTVVFKQIRLADADRVAELEFVLNEVKEFARKLTRPAVTHLLVVVHQRPCGENIIRKRLGFVFNRRYRAVVRMLIVVGNRIGALFRLLNRRGLFDIRLFDRSLSYESKDENEQNQNGQDDPKVVLFEILWFETAFCFCHFFHLSAKAGRYCRRRTRVRSGSPAFVGRCSVERTHQLSMKSRAAGAEMRRALTFSGKSPRTGSHSVGAVASAAAGASGAGSVVVSAAGASAAGSVDVSAAGASAAGSVVVSAAGASAAGSVVVSAF